MTKSRKGMVAVLLIAALLLIVWLFARAYRKKRREGV